MSARTACGDARVLHLDRDVAPVVQPRAVDLPDRGGGDRLGLERVEDVLDRLAELGLDHLAHVGEADLRRGVAQLAELALELLAVLLRDEPDVEEAHHLPELHRRALHRPERGHDLLGRLEVAALERGLLALLAAADVRRTGAEMACRLARGETGHPGGARDARRRDPVLGHIRGRRRRRRWRRGRRRRGRLRRHGRRRRGGRGRRRSGRGRRLIVRRRGRRRRGGGGPRPEERRAPAVLRRRAAEHELGPGEEHHRDDERHGAGRERDLPVVACPRGRAQAVWVVRARLGLDEVALGRRQRVEALGGRLVRLRRPHGRPCGAAARHPRRHRGDLLGWSAQRLRCQRDDHRRHRRRDQRASLPEERDDDGGRHGSRRRDHQRLDGDAAFLLHPSCSSG